MSLRRVSIALTALAAMAAGASQGWAALNPVLFYDASVYEGTEVVLDSVIEDQSTANHDATIRFNDVFLSDDVPAGLTGRSFDLTGIGMIDSLDARLLLNQDVVNAGGFVMEAWFKHDVTSGAATGKVIDYGGYERIQFAGSNSGPVGIGPLNNKNQFEFRMSNTAQRVGGRLPAELDNNWHYALAEFVVTDGSNLANVLGNMRITIDGQADVRVDGAKTDAGDNAGAPNYTSKLSIGTRSTVNPANPGGSGDNLEGLVYQPKVWLGTVADPVRLHVNTTSGAVSVRYVEDAVIPGATRFGHRIDAYQITSPDGALIAGNWNSLQEQNLDPNPGIGEDGRFDADDDADGADFLQWQRDYTDALPGNETTPPQPQAPPFVGANATADLKINTIDLNLWKAHYGAPTHWQELTSGSDSLGEFHGTHGTVVDADSPLSLGNIFDVSKQQQLTFTYSLDGDPLVRTGIIEYSPTAAAVPEPSAVVLALATLGGLGLLGRRRRQANAVAS